MESELSPDDPEYFIGYEPQRMQSKTHRHLPHWEQRNATYFVTFRLGDSIAAERLRQWQEARLLWLELHPFPWNEVDARYFKVNFPGRLNSWLDRGYGACYFRNASCRQLLEQTLKHKDGIDYFLGDYVIMPNHVHCLVRPMNGCFLNDLLKTWKGVSARKVNTFLRGQGSIWMAESFDHIVRNRERLALSRDYIRMNPVKAGLPEEDYTLGVGQAKWPSHA